MFSVFFIKNINVGKGAIVDLEGAIEMQSFEL